MSKIFKSWPIIDDENELYERILNNAGWFIVRMADTPTVYLSHKYSGRIVEINFEEFESTTVLDIFDEFIKKENAK